jgi:hypothetical protein
MDYAEKNRLRRTHHRGNNHARKLRRQFDGAFGKLLRSGNERERKRGEEMARGTSYVPGRDFEPMVDEVAGSD